MRGAYEGAGCRPEPAARMQRPASRGRTAAGGRRGHRRTAMLVDTRSNLSARRGPRDPVGPTDAGSARRLGHDRRRHRVRPDATTGTRIAWGYGLATVTDDGATSTPGTPTPALGEPPRRRRPARGAGRAVRAGGHGPAARRPHGRRPDGRSTSTRRRPTRPTPTCGCTCSRTGWSARTAVDLTGHLRRARQRRLDRPRARAPWRTSSGPGCACWRARRHGCRCSGSTSSRG